MKKLILILIVLTGISFSGKSSHAVGGDISLIQTGPNQYTINFRLFRYCTGAGAPASITGARIMDNVTNAIQQTFTLAKDSTVTIAFGDECYTPPGLCVEVHYYSGTLTVPNNANGYYVTWTLCCRNAPIVNHSGGSLTLTTQFPDPALTGGNNTPVFVQYPRDGYFCIGSLKCIDFSCTDADGDSLVYTLVNPINSTTGGARPFNLLGWNAGFNLLNILGPGSQCTMNQNGCVMARPAQLGLFIISVRVDEYRNGVNIGHVVRDIQYAALNCNTNELPDFYDFETVRTLQFDKAGCFDIASFDRDPEDTFFVDVISDAFQYGAIVTLPAPNTGGTYDFSWKNQTTGATDTINNVNVKKLTATRFEGVGRVGIQFCWTPDQCEVLAQDSFNIQLFGYSLGCDGSKDSISKEIKIILDKPQSNYNVPNVFTPNGDGIHDEFTLEQGAFDRCYDALNVRIYNRWGQLIYESDEAQFKWNGRDENGNEVVEGTYFVVLQGFYGGKEVTQNFPLTLFR